MDLRNDPKFKKDVKCKECRGTENWILKKLMNAKLVLRENK